MAGLINYTEMQQSIDRIQCVTFKQTRDAGAQFITRSWIAKKLKRSEQWVRKTWNKKPEKCFTNYQNFGRPLI
jgi:hypothetical protein